MWKHPLSFVSSKIRLLFHGRIHQKCDHLRYLMKTSPEWTLLWPHVWYMMVVFSLDPYLETCWSLPTNTIRWEQMGPPKWSTGFQSTAAPPDLWCGPIPRVSVLICKIETALAVLFLLPQGMENTLKIQVLCKHNISSYLLFIPPHSGLGK